MKQIVLFPCLHCTLLCGGISPIYTSQFIVEKSKEKYGWVYRLRCLICGNYNTFVSAQDNHFGEENGGVKNEEE